MVFCFVIGTEIESSLGIKVDEDITISELKTLIYKQKKSSFKDKGFDASDLRLWKVNISVAERKKLKQLEIRSRDETKSIQKLGGEELSTFDDFNDIFRESSRNIRILVQPPLPATTGKCLPTFYLSNKKFSVISFFYSLIDSLSFSA